MTGGVFVTNTNSCHRFNFHFFFRLVSVDTEISPDSTLQTIQINCNLSYITSRDQPFKKTDRKDQFRRMDIDIFFQQNVTVLNPQSRNIYKQISYELQNKKYVEFEQENKIPNGLKWVTEENRAIRLFAMREDKDVRTYALKAMIPFEPTSCQPIYIHLAEGQLQYRLSGSSWSTQKGQQWECSTFKLCSSSLYNFLLEFRIARLPVKMMIEVEYRTNPIPIPSTMECLQRPTEEELEQRAESYRLTPDARNVRILAVNLAENEEGRDIPIEISIRDIHGTEIMNQLIAPRCKIRDTYPDITGIRREELTRGKDTKEIIRNLNHALYGFIITGF